MYKMSPVIRKAIKALKYLVLSVGILLFLLILLINFSFVHVMIKNKANTWLQEKGIPASIGSISFSLTGKLKLKDIKIIPDKSDTIIFAGAINSEFRVLPLLANKLVVDFVSLENGVINLATNNAGELNLLSLFPSSPKDSTEENSSGNSWDVRLKHVQLENITFRYKDLSEGIEIFEYLKSAEIRIDNFSILKQVIDVNTLTIHNSS